MQRCPTSVLIVTFSLAVIASPSARADSCQPVFDALTKIVTTPSHSYTTSTRGGKAQTAETIMTQGKKYIRVNGRWMNTPVTTEQVLAQEKEREKSGKATCQMVRSELVGGDLASVYSMHRESDGVTEDEQIWISKVTGRALRAEEDLNMAGESGKEHRSARFEYSNVVAPM